MGRIRLREQPAKPARDIKAGDLLTITNDSATYGIEVLALSDVRGPAAVAQALYRETEASIATRKKEDEARKIDPWFNLDAAGRPNKRDRRDINRLRGR
jgi:ribosome-associated heat shock protein Hsp15